MNTDVARLCNHSGDLGQQKGGLPRNEPFAGDLFCQFRTQDREAGAGGNSREDEEKERGGPDVEAPTIREGPGVKNAVHAPEGTLMEKGEEGAGGGKDGHDVMKVVSKEAQFADLPQFAVFQDQRHVLDGQHP